MNNIKNNQDQYEFIQQDFMDITKSYSFIDSLNQLKFSATDKVCFMVRTQSRVSMFYYLALSNSTNNLTVKNLAIIFDSDECLIKPDTSNFIVIPRNEISISSKYFFLFLKQNQLILQDGNYAIYRHII